MKMGRRKKRKRALELEGLIGVLRSQLGIGKYVDLGSLKHRAKSYGELVELEQELIDLKGK